MRKLFLGFILAVIASGCATQHEFTPEEKLRQETARIKHETAIAEAARAQAYKEAARYKAVSDLATSKSKSTNIGPAMTLLSLEGILQRPQEMRTAQIPMAVQQSRTPGLYEWVMGLGSLAVNGIGIHESNLTARAQSRNQRDVQMRSYAAMEGLGSNIQAPGAVTNSYSIGGNGVLGNGSYSYLQEDIRTASGTGSSTAGEGNYAYTYDGSVVDRHDSYDYTHSPTVVYPEVVWSTIP